MMRKLSIGVTILAIALLGMWCLLFITPGLNIDSSILPKLFNVREIATPPADLIAAKARWLANPVAHYRLRIIHDKSTYPHEGCIWDVEVLKESVITTFEDTCSSNGYLQQFAPLGNTVTILLAKFQKEATSIHFKEQSNPGCGKFLGVEVVYSSAGYPTSAAYSWYEVSPWTLGGETYKSMYGDGPRIVTCMSATDPRPPGITITLQPLP